MLTLILGFNNSFKYVNFDTGAKSAELTSIGNQAWYVPLSLVIFSLGNFAPSAFWVLITSAVFFSLSSFNSSWVRQVQLFFPFLVHRNFFNFFPCHTSFFLNFVL